MNHLKPFVRLPVVLLVGIAGCLLSCTTLSEDSKQPAAAAPARFKEASGQPASQAGIPEKGWVVSENQEPDEREEEALRTGPTLQTAAGRVTQAKGIGRITEADRRASESALASGGASMTPLYTALLAWAVTLSGYPAPSDQVEVSRLTHEQIVSGMCGGQECRVRGFYKGDRVVYIDESLDPEKETYDASILVHEFIHYLQWQAGKVANTCGSYVENEREAYAIQAEFLHRHGINMLLARGNYGVRC